jgi:uncharacterized protein (DUF58 family)
MSIAAWLTPQLINRLEALELSVRWVRAGAKLGGRFAINRRGSSMEFADYAAYTPGDDIRAIDWNLYARLDRLYVKTYKEEIQLAVELIVDATASMGWPGPEKFEAARRLAVSLAYVALADAHQVRLSWIAPGTPSASPWFQQRRDVFRLAAQADAEKLGGGVSPSEWVRRASGALRWHGGQAIVITDGMSRPAELFRALHLLNIRNMEVKLIQVISPQELRPGAAFRAGTVVDAETGQSQQLGYSPAELERAVADHNAVIMRFCKQRGIPFAQYRLGTPLEPFITRTLPARGFLQ